jgi:DNA-binding NtrC family response regulator
MLKDKLVLLVDDEPSILTATRAGLMDRGFRVEAVGGAEDALRVIRSSKPSIVVSDLVMPGTNGFELFETTMPGNSDGRWAERRTSPSPSTWTNWRGSS